MAELYHQTCGLPCSAVYFKEESFLKIIGNYLEMFLIVVYNQHSILRLVTQ